MKANHRAMLVALAVALVVQDTVAGQVVPRRDPAVRPASASVPIEQKTSLLGKLKSTWDGALHKARSLWQSGGEIARPPASDFEFWLAERVPAGADAEGEPVDNAIPPQIVAVRDQQGQRFKKLLWNGDDRGLTSLGRVPDLRWVEFGLTNVSDASMAGLAGLDRLTVVKLQQTRVGDEGLSRLGPLPNLVGLTLHDSRVTAAGLAHLRQFPHLSYLNISWTQVGDEGLSQLTAVPRLEALFAMNAGISDAGLARLEGHTQIKSLRIGYNAISEDGLAHLVQLRELQELWLEHTDVTDHVVPLLRAFPSLFTLKLADTQISDSGVAQLKILPQLECLDLSNLRVTNEGVQHLRACRSLQVVILDGTEITDAALAHLATLPPPLVDLSLRGTEVTDVGVFHLTRFPGLERLSLKESAVSEACLNDLAMMKQLRFVDLRNTRIAAEAVEQLQAARPKLQIMH